MPYLIENLEIADNPVVLFRGIVGSRAYGTQNANSDTDVRGIFVVPSSEYARLAQPPKQVSDERNDRTYYSLVRFCELMAEANPTTMEMLFLPEDCILKTSPAHSMLVANRRLFVTQKAVDSHLGYALSQIKKAKGTNKRVWNPWPEEPPQAEDYCLFLGDAKGRAVRTFGTHLGGGLQETTTSYTFTFKRGPMEKDASKETVSNDDDVGGRNSMIASFVSFVKSQ